jgi:hypothetical protein
LTYSCRNALRIFLNFWHDIKKWCFDIHFDVFCQKSGCGDILPTPPPPFCLVLLSIQITRGWEKSHRAMVRSTVRRQSTFQSVSGPGPRRVRGVAGSQPGPLSLSFYFIAGAAPFWADFRNRSALWHTTQIQGEVSLHLVKARSKLIGPRYLTYFPDPSWFRVKVRSKLNRPPSIREFPDPVELGLNVPSHLE